MEKSKKGYILMFCGITLSKSMCPKTQDGRIQSCMLCDVLDLTYHML